MVDMTKTMVPEQSIDEIAERTQLLPEFIYNRLRLDIFNGVLEPGQSLRQEELARNFQVSRVPLREAMSRLEADGLIVLRPRRGYAVTSLDQAEILEILELRMAIEEHAGDVAARARTPEDVERVKSIMNEMEKLDPRSPDYVTIWSQLNRKFHARIVAASRRTRLSDIASKLRDAVECYVRVEVQMTGNVVSAEREHREIFEAFKAGDSVGLAQLSRKHVESTSRRLLDALRNKVSGRDSRPRRGKTASSIR